MITICKNYPPLSLKKFVPTTKVHGYNKNEPFYDEKVKSELQNSLLHEQGHYCAYCMANIQKENMRIEHIKPRKHFRILTYKYDNLLAVCNSPARRPKESHCDISKGNNMLNAIDKIIWTDIETFIYYKPDGRIGGFRPDVEEDIVKTDLLNLNGSHNLINNREEVFKIYSKEIYKLKKQGISDKDLRYKIKKIRKELLRDADQPYVGVALYTLKVNLP